MAPAPSNGFHNNQETRESDMSNHVHESRLRYASIAAVVATFVSGAAIAETMRTGVEPRLETTTAARALWSSQVDQTPPALETANNASTFSMNEADRDDGGDLTFGSPTSGFGHLAAYATDTGPSDVAAAWNYRHYSTSDPELSFGYTARARIDTAPGAVTNWRRTNEYLVRADIQRHIGSFTPRAEVGYSYLPQVRHDVNAAPRLFSAIGVMYHHSDRSTLEFFLDQRMPVEGGVTQRELSLTWTERTSARTRVIFYAGKSLSERWYDAGVKLSMRF
jgi:hypothetical protein